MKKTVIIIFVVLLLIPVISLTMQIVGKPILQTVHTPTEAATVSPGDVVDYQITVISNWINPVDDKIELPSLTGIQAISKPKTSLTNGGFTNGTWQINFSLLAYDIPDKETFRLRVPFKSLVAKKQKAVEILLPLFKLKTDFESEGKLEISETVDKLTDPSEPFPVKTLVLIMIIVAISVTVIVLYFGREKEVKKIVIPPWITANGKIDSIKSRLPMPDEQFFVELSDLLRVYIEALYKLPATESTTKEFLSEMQRSSLLNKETKLTLGAFMIEADMIKFAKQQATEEQMSKSLETSETFVKTSSQDFINREKTNA